ncbi:hypothetical protein NE237_011274 [Protea cynaroides]|uniref:Uncharacterized protein n=1 Tax=Protea cynaroides TaxID=273540 RepID=A0A9Q0GWR4_9MAGN|nr:hypothetical protein NE237_011274 [Protea cynaroides]
MKDKGLKPDEPSRIQCHSSLSCSRCLLCETQFCATLNVFSVVVFFNRPLSPSIDLFAFFLRSSLSVGSNEIGGLKNEISSSRSVSSLSVGSNEIGGLKNEISEAPPRLVGRGCKLRIGFLFALEFVIDEFFQIILSGFFWEKSLVVSRVSPGDPISLKRISDLPLRKIEISE